MKTKEERHKALTDNFWKNVGQFYNDVSDEMRKVLEFSTEEISNLSFDDCICQYSVDDKSIDCTLYFIHDIKASLSIFIEDYNEVSLENIQCIYLVYHDKKLLVSNEMKLTDFVKTMQSVIDKVSTYTEHESFIDKLKAIIRKIFHRN